MKALIVIAPENFRDEEYEVPKEILEDVGVDVETASTIEDECKGMRGLTIEPDLKVSEASARNYDAVVVAGGGGSQEYLWDDEDLLDLVSDAVKSDKIVAGICMSAAVLANAGVLNGKEATVFDDPAGVDALYEGGAKYVKEDVVVDGKIITANGPKAAQEFGDTIVELLDA